MNHRLEIYLDLIIAYAGLPADQSEATRKELADHLLSKTEDLQRDGATMDDAVFRAIHDHGRPRDVGYALRPRFPLIDVRTRGTARGLIAIGPKAVGLFACGFVSTGLFSCGLVSFGVVSFGLVACAVSLGVGVFALASLAMGMNSVGLFARGFNSLGVVAAGENAHGVWCLPEATNPTTAYFGPMPLPDWIRELAFMLDWNARETFMALSPLLLAFVALILIAVLGFRKERDRLQSQKLKPWIFE